MAKTPGWLIPAAIGGAVGLGLLLFRRRKVPIAPQESIDSLPSEDLVTSSGARLPKSPSYHRTPPSGRSATGSRSSTSLNPNLAWLDVTIKQRKYIISYTPKQWQKGARLLDLFEVGQVLSYKDGSKFISRFGIDTGAKDAVVASTPAEYASFVASNPGLLGKEPPGFWSDHKENGRILMGVEPGAYMLTPNLQTLQQSHQDFYSGFWTMTSHGPSIPSGAWFADRLMKRKCTKYWTKITMSNGGSPLHSAKAVQAVKGKVTKVTLQPYSIISVRRKVWQDTESKAFNYFCETMGFVGEKLPDWVTDLFVKFAKWFG